MDSDSFKRSKFHRFRYAIPVFLVLGCISVLFYFISSTPSNVSKKQGVVQEDSLPFLHSIGVNTLISDSGVLRYRIVAEEWDIYTPQNSASTWKFIKGMLMLRLDKNFEVDLYVQADTAYFHNQEIWELRGRVRVRNLQGTKFNTEELFWNIDKHEIWNHAYMKIISPERTLEGTEFRSNEEMTRYSVMNSKGDFPMTENETADSASNAVATSSAEASPILPSVASPSLADKTPPIQKLNIKEAELIEATKENTINLQDKKRKLDVFQ
jgi:LPS export ABC transporter protein LptC